MVRLPLSIPLYAILYRMSDADCKSAVNDLLGSTPRGCTTYISECGKVWLIRMPWEHETVGSNPAIRTTTYLKYLICAVSSVGRARDF